MFAIWGMSDIRDIFISGVLFSYASIIFREFYCRDSKEPRESPKN